MGDDFLEQQAKNAKKRRAKAVASASTPKLFNRPDTIIDQYTVDFRDGVELHTGDKLLCFQSVTGTEVDVARGHERIGQIGADGGAEGLLSVIKTRGAARVFITSVNNLAGVVKVRVEELQR